jgi:limonene-1,2-epoxide hydrolase
MIVPSSYGTMSARMRIVEEHVTRENEHNLDGIMDTFGEKARYDDEGWGAHYQGRQEVRKFYAEMLQAIPDLHLDIRRRHAGEDAIIVEVVITRTPPGNMAGTARHWSPNGVSAMRRFHIR